MVAFRGLMREGWRRQLRLGRTIAESPTRKGVWIRGMQAG